jgi:ferredoxin-NADP reductase
VTEAPASHPPEPKLRWQDVTITAIMLDTPRVKSFMLAPSRPFPFRARQHVDVRLTAPNG